MCLLLFNAVSKISLATSHLKIDAYLKLHFQFNSFKNLQWLATNVSTQKSIFWAQQNAGCECRHVKKQKEETDGLMIRNNGETAVPGSNPTQGRKIFSLQPKSRILKGRELKEVETLHERPENGAFYAFLLNEASWRCKRKRFEGVWGNEQIIEPVEGKKRKNSKKDFVKRFSKGGFS